jgi:hypothetical protein
MRNLPSSQFDVSLFVGHKSSNKENASMIRSTHTPHRGFGLGLLVVASNRKGICSMNPHRFSLLAAMALALAVVSNARAADLAFTIQEVGADVVMTGSGSVNLAGLVGPGTANRTGSVNPSLSAFTVGPAVTATSAFWSALNAPRPAIGTGTFTQATSGTGDMFGLITINNGGLYLPVGYVSGTPLSGQSIFAGRTLNSLGLTPGTYNYTWGSGVNAGSLSMTISVPEPSTYALAAIATGVMAAIARRRKARRA